MSKFRLNARFKLVKFDGPKIVNQLRKVAKDALAEVAQEVIKDARPLIPKDTGKLRDSGEIQDIDERRLQVVWSAITSERFDYAPMQYFKKFRHTDPPGVYAGMWFDRVMESNAEVYLAMIVDRIKTFFGESDGS